MKIERHIANKIKAISDDEVVCRALNSAAKLLDSLNTRYGIVGSCGLQSHFASFFRLPNDLDVILPLAEIEHLRQRACAQGYEFVDQLGRARLYIDDFPVHLIPEQMNIIDKDTNTVFAQVDLGCYLMDVRMREMRFVNSHLIPKMPTFPLEPILFVDLIRPIYTGSVMSLSLVLRDLTISEARLGEMFETNKPLCPVVLANLKRYPHFVKQASFLTVKDKDVITERLATLTAGIITRVEASRPL